MSYADRLKDEIRRNGVTPSTDKTDKTPFVSFVGTSSAPISAEQRIRDGMAKLWDRHGWREHKDFAEALRIAVAMPDAALTLLAAEGVL